MINNAFYDFLDEKWLNAQDHPVALLRAENRLRIPWVIETLATQFLRPVFCLDVGCGAGLLTNALARIGHKVSGVDLSERSLAIAKKTDATKTVAYCVANGDALPFPDGTFDAVSLLDVLEHVEMPGRLIAEASRVLKPGGLFFFHTFNRNFLSYLVVIKGVEWFVRNTPPNMHLYSLFLKPKELTRLCQNQGLLVQEIRGVRPKFFTLPFCKMLLTRHVDPAFSFQFTKNLTTGYCGFALKEVLDDTSYV